MINWWRFSEHMMFLLAGAAVGFDVGILLQLIPMFILAAMDMQIRQGERP